MPHSQNGYPANDINQTTVYDVPGSERDLRLRKGPAGALLAAFAAAFDADVEDIDAGQPDDWSYAERPIRGGTELSNHASGTAIDLNALRHPLGVTGTFRPEQIKALRKLLSRFGYAIRWGGDYQGRKDEMHFEVVVNEDRCRKILAKVQSREDDDMKTTDPVTLGEFASEARGGQKEATVGGLLGDAAAAAYLAEDARDAAREALETGKKNAVDLKEIKTMVGKLAAAMPPKAK